MDSSCDLSLHRVLGGTTKQYVRPSEWPDIAGDIGPTDEKFVGLYMVADSAYEKVSILATTSTGDTINVNWGDGTSSTINSDDTNYTYHTYSYSDTDLTSTSYGYKVAKITITPNGGNITRLVISGVDGSGNFPEYGIPAHRPNWLDIDMRLPSATLYKTSGSSSVAFLELLEKIRIRASAMTNLSFLLIGCIKLEMVEELNTGTVTLISSIYQGCRNLISIPHLNFPSATNATNALRDCTKLETLPASINLSSVINVANMFMGCTSLKSIPPLSLTSCTITNSMFVNCTNLTKVSDLGLTTALTNTSLMYDLCVQLTEVPYINLVNVTNTSSMYRGCNSIKTLPAMNLTASTNCQSMFQNCFKLEYIGAITMPSSTTVNTIAFNNNYALREIASGWRFYQASGTISFSTCTQIIKYPSVTWANTSSINISYQKLDATNLNAIYTALPSATSKTINVAGNPWNGHTPSIATAKGWTVTT